MSERTTSGQPGSIVEVEFVTDNSAHPFVGAYADGRCTFELAEMLPRDDGQYSEFSNVTGSDIEQVESHVSDKPTVDATLHTTDESGGLFEFVVSGDCPALRLAELGALPRQVRGVEGSGHIVAEIPERYDPATVVESFLDDHPDATLNTKREKESMRPMVSRSVFQRVLQTQLTDRQREVLEAAFDAGYYDWPRECTGADVAAELDITSATFSEHIHAAERNLLTVLFDGQESSPEGA